MAWLSLEIIDDFAQNKCLSNAKQNSLDQKVGVGCQQNYLKYDRGLFPESNVGY